MSAPVGILRTARAAPAIGSGRDAKRGVCSLRELARLATPHAEAGRAVSRSGRVVAASETEARIVGLSAHAAPGMVVRVGDEYATIARVDRAVCVATLDRPGARPDDTATLLPPPAEMGGAWLGRTVDALGHPGGHALHDERALDGFLPLDPDRPVTTGVGAIDALVPVMPGEVWAVRGDAGSGRTTLLRMIAECGAWDAVVLCTLATRSRERAAWSAGAANRMTVMSSRGAGPAEAAATLALAVSAARGLVRTHPRTVLLVDGASVLPALDGVTAFVAGDAVASDGREPLDGAIVLDASLAELGTHPAVDIAATLRASPPPPGDDGAHAALRALAGRGDREFHDVRAALAQSPGAHDAAPDPGAIVTRSAVVDLARAAQRSDPDRPFGNGRDHVTAHERTT